MKRNSEDMTGHLVRPPGWNQSSSQLESHGDNRRSCEDDDAPPARKILKRLLEDEVQKAMCELNEEVPTAKTKIHRAASLIPEFDPDSDDCTTVKAWLRKIDQLGEIHGWNDNMKAFHLQDKLRGQARRWYNRLDDYDYSWVEWKEILTRAFPRHRDYGNMLDEMMNRKKLSTESMTKYYQDKVAMCFRCKLSDIATVSCIIRGLPFSLQANARAYQCNRPEELYEGFLCALDDYQPPSNNIRPSSSVKDNVNRQPMEKKIINPDVDPCPRCKKTGHILRNCPQPDQRTCFKCGKQGHIAPRCTAITASTATSAPTTAMRTVREIKVLQNYNHIYEKVAKVNDIYIKSYLDTGSEVNVLSMHVCKLLKLEVTPTDAILKGFAGNHLSSHGEVAFHLEIDGILIHSKAHLTDVDMGGIHLLVGQPVINGDGMTLMVSNGVATLKQENMLQMEVIEERTRFKVVTIGEECLPPGSSIIKVNIIDNNENNDVVTSPQHFDLSGVSYSIPATMLRGTTGYIKIVNTGTRNIIWRAGDVLTRADSCSAPPVDNVETFRHGFPFSPTALAWDPIQKLLAIGDKGGNLRILGGPGVDAHARHEAGEAVLRAQFLVNEGALVTATADDQLHLWTFRQKSPQRVQSLKFQRERITCLHLPLQSKWVHVGTERGNVHVVNIETFALSGYVINWNKAIEVTRTNHPGAVVEICDNPLDANKLLVAFETGLVVVWDLRARAAEWRGSLGQPGEGIRAAAWQQDGKLMTAHVDGALAVWSTRQPRPTSLSYPHAKANKDGKLEPCKPIHRLEWKTSKTGESLVIFSGGLPTDKAGRTHSVTVLNGKSTTVLEMEHSVVDFVTLCESPHTADYQEPYAIVVLLQNDLVVIDLQTPGYPCFENPYPMDIHESPVTCCSYFADCPSDLIPAFYSVGRQGNKKATGFSDKLWPINGGEWAPASCSYSEIILTGHADGSIKFWDASAGTLQILYKLKCSKVFERRGSVSSGYGGEDSPLAIQQAALCAESRRLCAALPHGHVVLFKFRKAETHAETHVLEIPMITDSLEEEASPEPDGSRSASFSRGGDSIEGESRRSGVWAGGAGAGSGGLRVRGAAGTGGARRAPGFQAALVALQLGAPSPITALTINSSYGLMAWGGERGVVVVDVSRRAVVAALAAHALYGPLDPWGRHERHERHETRAREPSIDQLEDVGAATAPAAPSPAEPEDAPDPPPKLDARRKSTPWKTFNLKRQLSKVDLKLKAAFAVPSEPNLEEKIEDPSSQFPSEAPAEKAEVAIEALSESPSSESVREEESAATSPARGNAFDRMAPEAASDPYDRMHRELQARWQERDEAAARPDSLPLGEEPPVRPPRAREREAREQRLLSVPNIKYGKQAEVRDLRRRVPAPGAAPGAQPSFAGNLMRRFREYLARLCPRDAAGDGAAAASSPAPIEPPIPQSLASMEYLHIMQPNDKLDSSFSRSRSSSMSSLENISQEGIQCLAFADSYTKKSDPTTLLPTLWIGTTLGSVLTMMISLPEADNRHTQPVVVSMSGGPIFRLKGSILAMSFLDCNGALIPYSFESWKDDAKDVRGSRERTPTKQSSSGSGSRMSPTPGAEGGSSVGDRQFVVIASEKQARVVALPSQNCVYRQQIVDTDFVVKAEIVSLKDSVCLVNYLSTGHLAAYSLPSLRPLVHVDFLPLSELSFQTQSKQRGIVDPMLSIWGQQLIVNEDTDQIAKTFCFSNRGHGLFLASPTEIQKFTIDAEFCCSLNEMIGELFLPRDMPEPPKESFFRGLFGGGSRPLDREELFGEGSGKPNRTVAKVIPGPKENLEQLGARASTASSEIARAHMLAVERGDKLSQLEERTERMTNEAAQFSSSAHQLMLKYKDKKWYQL